MCEYDDTHYPCQGGHPTEDLELAWEAEQEAKLLEQQYAEWELDQLEKQAKEHAAASTVEDQLDRSPSPDTSDDETDDSGDER